MKKINKKIEITSIVISSLFICIFAFVVIQANKLENIVETSSSTIINNKKIGWGIKRAQDNKQPDLGTQNKQLLENNKGIAIGNEKDKNIYLTFDEGYEAGYTKQILEILKQNNVKAAFFITAHYLNTQEEIVKQMIDEGHIVGNHTVNHKSMPDLTDEKIKKEVMDLHQSIYEKYGYEMKYIRPPMGEFSERTLNITNSLGYKTVMWSFAYCDWDENKQPQEENAKKTVLENIHNGEIILLHGNSKTNTNILDFIIKEIKNMGYEFKTLDEFK